MLSYFDDLSARHKLAPAVLAAVLSACATETVLLNSERIERRFGSYGIDVLASEAGLRRSSLYSMENGQRVCRTYAVVRFSNELDSSFGAEHAKVLAGNSLGEVFKANGWKIHKQTLHIGAVNSGGLESPVAQLMELAEASPIALHVYQLLLARGEQVYEYATIVEAHHPDYLSEADLLKIYSYTVAETLGNQARKDIEALLLGDSVD